MAVPSNGTLSVLSWNVWVFNHDIPGAVQLVARQLEAHDVVCLQEVSQEMLNRLREVFPCEHIFTSTDTTRGVDAVSGALIRDWLVVITKLPIVSMESIPLRVFPNSSRLARFFCWYLGRKYLNGDKSKPWFPLEQPHREATRVVVQKGGKTITLYNVHLTFWRATARYRELLSILSKTRYDDVSLIAGDLNIFDSRICLVNWALNLLTGDSLSKVGPWFNEKKFMARLFARYGLSNVLVGRPTFPSFEMQLDHFLVPYGVKVSGVQVMEGLHGSDHRPISIGVIIEEKSPRPS